jgi:adenylate kinase
MRRERESSSALSRLLAWIVLALMASATLYSAWIAIVNFNRIGV